MHSPRESARTLLLSIPSKPLSIPSAFLPVTRFFSSPALFTKQVAPRHATQLPLCYELRWGNCEVDRAALNLGQGTRSRRYSPLSLRRRLLGGRSFSSDMNVTVRSGVLTPEDSHRISNRPIRELELLVSYRKQRTGAQSNRPETPFRHRALASRLIPSSSGVLIAKRKIRNSANSLLFSNLHFSNREKSYSHHFRLAILFAAFQPRGLAKLQRTLIYGNGINSSRKLLKTKDRAHA